MATQRVTAQNITPQSVIAKKFSIFSLRAAQYSALRDRTMLDLTALY